MSQLKRKYEQPSALDDNSEDAIVLQLCNEPDNINSLNKRRRTESHASTDTELPINFHRDEEESTEDSHTMNTILLALGLRVLTSVTSSIVKTSSA